VIRQSFDGAQLKALIDKAVGPDPSQLSFVPIVRTLLTSETPGQPGLDRSKPQVVSSDR
jgi:hypothetical protein